MFKKGFTLIETLVSLAVFLVIITAAYQTYISLFHLIDINQYKIIALNLANEQLELARNLPYSDVGIVGGIPNGKIPHTQNITRSGVPFIVTTTIRNIDLPFDGTIGGTPNDLSPADNKLVDVEIDCPTCTNYATVELSTNVAPKNLETASTNGALFIKVFDANGVPVSDANVHIVNSKATSTITIDDVTDANGLLQIVDAPPGVEAYAIMVTKPGYSSARTYPTGGSGNPTPSLPDATVLLQQVTQISFAIDKISTVTVKSVTPSCTAVSGMDFSLVGSKLIGTNVYKFSQNLVTNSSGNYSTSTMEWDTYTMTGIDGSYDVIGINPLNPIVVNPDTTQDVLLIVAPKNPKSILVTVKDSSTQLPIADANVTVTDDGSYNTSKITGRGFINQSDWSLGSGQTDYVNTAQYATDDGNVDVTSSVGEIRLANNAGVYASNGYLESSTIDTGASSNFYNLVWSPVDQPIQTGADSVRFQFATNAADTATTTWNYVGPDGTSATYYTTSNAVLSSVHNGDRYARYKVFLSTANTGFTPNISDIAFTFTTLCTPPGQVIFSGLPSATYHVSVGKIGYSTTTVDVPVSSNWTEKEVLLAP